MLTIPNIISFFRILIAFLFPWLYCGKYRLLSLVLLLVSGLSDIADGFIARKFNQISEAGKILDPVADKLTHFMILLAFCISDGLPVFIVVAFAVVQIGMMILASVFVKLGNKPFSSKWYGKLTSLLFFITSVLVIIYKSFKFDYPISAVFKTMLMVLALVTVFFFVYSLVGYISMALKANKERKAQQTASNN